MARWSLKDLFEVLESSVGYGRLSRHGGGKKNLEVRFIPFDKNEFIQSFQISAKASREKLNQLIEDFNQRTREEMNQNE